MLVIDEPFNHDITGIYRVPKGGIIDGLFVTGWQATRRFPAKCHSKIPLWSAALPSAERLCHMYILIKAHVRAKKPAE